MPVAGWLVQRVGSRRVTVARSSPGCRLVLASLSGGLGGLAVALFGFGAGFGAMNVSANAQGLALERRYGRSILSSFHAAFSAGALAGAGLGAITAALAIEPRANFGVAALVLVVVGLATGRRLLLPRQTTPGHHPSSSARPASCSSSARRRSSRCSPREPQPTGAPSISRTPLARPQPWPRSRTPASRSPWRRAAASAIA